MQLGLFPIARSLALWLVFLGLAVSGVSLDHRLGHSMPGGSFHRPGYIELPEAQLLSMFQSQLHGYPSLLRDDLSRYFLKLCKKYQFHPVFLMSVIDVESGFKVNAVSPKGAVGLMQVMPATADFISAQLRIPLSASSEALRDPYVNLHLGVAYLAWLRERYEGNAGLFLAAYNIGHGAVDRHVAAYLRMNDVPPRRKIYFESVYQRYFEKLAVLRGKPNV